MELMDTEVQRGSMEFPSPGVMKAELRWSSALLSAHGLLHSAKWAAEQAVGLGTSECSRSHDCDAVYNVQAVPAEEEDEVALAKVLYDVREFRRAAHALRGCSSHRAVFLRGYCLYLAGEKRKEDEGGVDSSGSSQGIIGVKKTPAANSEIAQLHRELSEADGKGALDAFGKFLFGVVLKHMDLRESARRVMGESCAAFPLNWSAWLELASLCDSYQQIEELCLPEHWVKALFLAHMDLELQKNKRGLSRYRELSSLFPSSHYVQSQMALASYNMRDFGSAQGLFEKILKEDPFRLDNLDTYSNILYVREHKTQLSFVAHNALRNEKYRPETCCIVGNYYSLKSQHEKAVLYFKRALQLNHQYLSAWTLMGHEYVEMRNTAAAIEAYRRALDITQRDYRAWYGLGQTYEILQMHFYSLHYFRKATALCPFDARMWCAMGQCYECLKMYPEAVKCYKRAHENSDREGIALNKLGKLYCEVMNDPRQAAVHYEQNLMILDAEQVESQQTMDALLFLARYFKNPELGRLDDAEVFCQRLHESYGADKEEVGALMKEIRQLKQRVPSSAPPRASAAGAGPPSNSFL